MFALNPLAILNLKSQQPGQSRRGKALRALVLAAAIGVSGTFGTALFQPAQAQMFSDGYEFLKNVKDRDGKAVTDALNEPGKGAVIVNARDRSSGETALHIVTKRRDTVWIRFLAKHGANPNIADKKGETPLVVASNLGFVDGIKALIKAGAKVDVASSTGETPLINAVHRRDTAMIKLLLDNGANPDMTDNSGRSARDYAALLKGNTLVLAEIERADKEREAGGGSQKTYGPSL